jgi:ornithine carbamoyltransferase
MGRRQYRDAVSHKRPLVRPPGFAGRDFLRIAGLGADELVFLLDLAAEVKTHPDTYRAALAGRTLALLFEKPSLRTRSTFEIGMVQLGGHALYLGPDEIAIGKRESVADIARNLERWVDAITARVFSHDTLVGLADHADVPVINALCDVEHPCQAIADFQTMREHLGELRGRTLAWVGDGNNVLHSLALAGAQLGVEIRVATPEGYDPDPDIIAAARDLGGDVLLTRDPREAVTGADVVYADTWISMGQEADAPQKEPIFRPYQINAALMAQASEQALFMHCLPAKRGKEVTDEVMDSPRSIVFDQAENRLHAQKAVLLALLT